MSTFTRLYGNAPFYHTYTMELGRCYNVSTRWGKPIKCVLIKTGVKGFNLLNPITSRCVLGRAMYQKNSSKIDNIPSSQTIFSMNVPSWIISVEATDEVISTILIKKEQVI